MKKRAITITALVLCVVLALSACAQGAPQQAAPTPGDAQTPADTAQQQPADPGGAHPNFNELGVFPLVREMETIHVYIHSAAAEFNPETNWFTGFYEEKTNVHVNWSVVPQEQYKERVNLAFASGEEIDLIFAGGNVATGFTMIEVLRFAEQGVIQPLNDLFDNHSVNFNRRIDEYAGWRELLTLPDGNIYTFPRMNDFFHGRFYTKMFLNRDWLDRLGLDYPTTTEEFHQVLLAFRDNDANGSGRNDEIPMAGAQANFHVWNSKVDPFLMNAFIYNDGENRLFLDNGQVIAAYAQPEWREGLRYINMLFNDGLIYIESFTMDKAARDRLNSQHFESRVGAMPSNIHFGSREPGEPARWIEYTPIKPLIGPTGFRTTRYCHFLKFQPDRSGGFIPVTSRNPELVVRWLDWFMTDEGMKMTILGPEGIGWVPADPGSTGVDGRPAVHRRVILPPDHEFFGNLTWAQAPPNVQTSDFRLAEQQPLDMRAPDGSGVEKYLYHYSRVNYYPYAPSADKILPPLFIPSDLLTEFAHLQTSINTFVEESLARFIIGDLCLDNDWYRYLEDLNNLGLVRYLYIVQTTYNNSPFVTGVAR